MNNHFIHELDPNLQEKLSLLKDVPPRDLNLKASYRAKYLAQVQQFSAKQNPVGLNAIWPFANPKNNQVIKKKPVSWNWQMAHVRAFAIVLVAVLVLLSGLGATAYAAQNSLPTSLFYPVKLLSENIRLDLTSNTESKFALVLTYADTRINEISALQASGEEIEEPVVDLLEEQYNLALLLASELPDEDLTQSLEQVRTTTQVQIEKMTTLRKSAPEESVAELERVQEMLERQQYLAQNGLTDPEAFRQAVQNEFKNGEPNGTPGNQNGSNEGNGSEEAEPGDSAKPQSGPKKNDLNSAQPGQGFSALPTNSEDPAGAPFADQESQVGTQVQPGDSNGRVGDGQEFEGCKNPGLELLPGFTPSDIEDDELGWSAKYGNPMYWYSSPGKKTRYDLYFEFAPFDGNSIFIP